MINTIFYFTDTQQEYTDNYAQGSVKPHTICFAKDTKTIWRDGQRFSGMLQNEVIDEINSIVIPAEERLDAGIQRALDAAADVSDNLNTKVAEINEEIATTNQGLLDEHQAMLDKAEELKGRLDRGEVTYNSDWNEDVKAYMQNVGMWDYGEDSSIVTKWSQLRQSISGVSSEVAEVRQTGDSHYNTLNTKIDQTASSITSQVDAIEDKADGYNTALQSKINQEVTARGEAITTLDNKYAKSTKDTQDVIEWLYSGLQSGISADKSYAEIIAAGKNGASQAISNLRTSIENTADGKYVAESSLASKVESNLSGIINRVTESSAGTSIFSQIGENTKDIAAVNTFIGEHSAQATLAAQIGEAKSGAIATVKDDLASLNILSRSSSGYEAGVYTKGEMGDAVASFIANDERNAASVIAQVNKEGSSLSLNADRINLGGQTWAEFITALDVTAQKVNVVDENESTVSQLLPNGTVRFMSGQIYVPHVSRTTGGEISGETGFVIISEDKSVKTYYQSSSIGCQSYWGIVFSGIFFSKPDEHGPGTTIINYGSTYSTAKYNEFVEMSMSRNHQVDDASGVGYFSLSNVKAAAGHVLSGTGKAEMVGWDVIKFETNNLKSNVSLVVSSDERLKTIVSDINLKAEDIAKARTVDFYYNDDSDKHIRIGSIAQDWQKIIPNAVQADKDGTLNLDYASAALVSVVSIAKELVAIKKENEELKQRLADIESKLTTI